MFIMTHIVYDKLEVFLSSHPLSISINCKCFSSSNIRCECSLVITIV